MWSIAIVVINELTDHRTRVTLIDHDQVIEAFGPNGPHDPLGDGVGFRRPWRSPQVGDAWAGRPAGEVATVDGIPVVNEVLRPPALGRCLRKLVPDPGSGRTGGDGGARVFGPNDGAAIAGFAKHAATLSTGAHSAVLSWYASFLQNIVEPNAVFFAYLVTFGEVLLGIGLIVGALTGIAALFGLVMNFNYPLANAVSTYPILGVLALFVILAWRIAGYYGVDRYRLPILGTPWTGPLPTAFAPANKPKAVGTV